MQSPPLVERRRRARQAPAGAQTRVTAPPAEHQAHGRLMRAIVSLPPHMCERSRAIQERIVFFDCPRQADAGHRLEALLALAWNTPTAGWCEQGHIYNITSTSELAERSDACDDTALLEIGWSSEGPAYACRASVDFFCTPGARSSIEQAMRMLTTQEGGAA